MYAFALWMNIFVFLYISSFPVGYTLFHDPASIFLPFYRYLALFTAEHVFGISESGHLLTGFESDSTLLYVHLFNLLIIAQLIAILFHFLLRRKISILKKWVFQIGTYYLSLQLLMYGLNKVFKWQFFLPEPNTMYTLVGDLDPDLLYWTTVGASYEYSLFSGLMEVIPALLLLFRRTQLLGLIIAFGVLIHVYAINISFDISVKVHAGFLLLLCGFLLLSYRSVLAVLWGRGQETLPDEQLFSNLMNKPRYFLLKFLLIATLIAESTAPYLLSGNYNDDLSKRPIYHGAYQLEPFGEHMVQPWKRLYFHRRHYLIVENERGEKTDFPYRLNEQADTIEFKTDYGYKSYRIQMISPIELEMEDVQSKLKISMKRLPYREMSLLRQAFHWSID